MSVHHKLIVSHVTDERWHPQTIPYQKHTKGLLMCHVSSKCAKVIIKLRYLNSHLCTGCDFVNKTHFNYMYYDVIVFRIEFCSMNVVSKSRLFICIFFLFYQLQVQYLLFNRVHKYTVSTKSRNECISTARFTQCS